jgi:hypothetical protein
MFNKSFLGVITSIVVIIIGCLLPWKYSGGFIAYPTNGIDVNPIGSSDSVIITIMALIIAIYFIYSIESLKPWHIELICVVVISLLIILQIVNNFIVDNGGIIILLLVIIDLILLKRIKLSSNLSKIILALPGTIISIICIIQIIQVKLEINAWGGRVELPALGIGVEVVIIGALLLIFSSIRLLKNKIELRPTNA